MDGFHDVNIVFLVLRMILVNTGQSIILHFIFFLTGKLIWPEKPDTLEKKN